jgi:hypothetical protein
VIGERCLLRRCWKVITRSFHYMPHRVLLSIIL